MEKYSRGRRGAPAKGVVRVTGARVQISPSPPKTRDGTLVSALFLRNGGNANPYTKIRRILVNVLNLSFFAKNKGLSQMQIIERLRQPLVLCVFGIIKAQVRHGSPMFFALPIDLPNN